jgi:hypothetical protein
MYSGPAVAEPIEGISVLQAADVQVVVPVTDDSKRGQVLDGIVRYGDELLIVIENKLDGSVDTRQAQDLNVHGSPVRFVGDVHAVSWRDLLARWSDLVESEVVVGAERTLIVDFLDFVERYFPRLGPFTTLGRCKDHPFRVSRRLNAVLGEIAAADQRTASVRSGIPARIRAAATWLELPGRLTVDRAYLEFEKSLQHIELRVYPADTLTQAKAFYSRPGAVSKVLSLRDGDGGWNVQANFHFGYMARGLAWTTTDAQLEEYVGYWCEQIGSVGPINRENGKWEEFWKELVERRFARNDQKTLFDQAFTNTARKLATPRPGLRCVYSWKLSEAKLLDDDNRLVAAVAEQLNIMLRALGEKPLDL